MALILARALSTFRLCGCAVLCRWACECDLHAEFSPPFPAPLLPGHFLRDGANQMAARWNRNGVRLFSAFINCV